MRWDPHAAVAAGVGPEEATRFLAADDFDFAAWNQRLDEGRRLDDAVAEVADRHPRWLAHVEAYVAHFVDSLSEMPANVAVLRDLHAAGVPLLALTNWSAELFPLARRAFDFLGLFDDVVVSGEEGVAKPDPAIFARLEARAGRPLTECVFLDDSPRNVAAGSAAGLDAFVYDGSVDVRAELAGRGIAI